MLHRRLALQRSHFKIKHEKVQDKYGWVVMLIFFKTITFHQLFMAQVLITSFHFTVASPNNLTSAKPKNLYCLDTPVDTTLMDETSCWVL